MDTFIIIGTAGRDKTKPMTLPLYKWMLNNAYDHVPKGSKVVSGGAAWADHLAVSLFLFDRAAEITLHLPAPFSFTQSEFVDGSDQFEDHGYKSAGGIANYYHRQFSQTIQRDTLRQIGQVLRRHFECLGQSYNPVQFTSELASSNMGGMFARNAKVAATPNAHLLAYTFGEGDEPADGGTKNTWDKFQGPKTHISLPILT